MISRRHFLKVFGGAIAFVSAGIPSALHAAAQRARTMMSDFGGMIQKPIKGFTDSTEEAVQIISNNGLIHPRGTGHSVVGQSIRENAMIFTPEPIDMVFNAEKKTVYASAGSTLLEIDDYLEQFGYMVPTSPDHRAVSLGGVLSVGGFGVEVCKYGPLVEHVVSVDLLRKDGTISRAVPADHADVRQVLGGVGQHDIILAAQINCLRKPLYNHLKLEPIKDADHFVASCRAYIEADDQDGMFDVFYAHWSDNGNQLMTHGYTIHEENKDAPLKEGYKVFKDYRANKKRISDDWTFRKPYKYFVWSDHFFKIDDLKVGLEKGLKIVEEARRDGGAAIIYSSLTKSNNTDTHFPHYTDDAGYVVSVGIFTNFLEEDLEAAKKCARSQMLYSKEMKERFAAGAYRYGWEWDENFKDLDLNL